MTINVMFLILISLCIGQVFEELLLDADWSVNAGMWMWLSCSSFFQQFFHCYCPVRFGRKADPNGDYIR
jgi:cryptochrome